MPVGTSHRRLRWRSFVWRSCRQYVSHTLLIAAFHVLDCGYFNICVNDACLWRRPC
jgi:hypothetical protein